MKGFKEELGHFLKKKSRKISKHESLKHAYERFQEFKEFLRNEHKDTYNDINKKILCVCHSAFINTATSPVPIISTKSHEKPKNLYSIKNGEIITLLV